MFEAIRHLVSCPLDGKLLPDSACWQASGIFATLSEAACLKAGFFHIHNPEQVLPSQRLPVEH